jgi:hypothetical protein
MVCYLFGGFVALQRERERDRCERSALGGDELGVLIPSRPVCEVTTGSHPGCVGDSGH